MILTEEEAKTKRCQESFPAAEGLTSGGFTESVPFPPNVISFNATGSYARQTAPSMCIASACMAWRWASDKMCLEGGYSQLDLDNNDFIAGYCGKAGKP